jgi:pimeloyl-ACP methyl ester carboxylesterase
MTDPLYSVSLPPGIRARHVDNGNGLNMHVLEAGDPSHPAILLLHGFPELAYSWRKVMPVLAARGYYVIAPDQRGYGLTTGWDPNYDGDLASFRFLNLLRDTLGLLGALGVRTMKTLVGHDFGSFAAAHFALIRPDVFTSCVLMSAPYAGPPALNGKDPIAGLDVALASLPRPRKHYHRYYSTRDANGHMWACEQGLHDFMRAYYHHKSADWKDNKPYRLSGWTADEMAKLPTYYVMDLGKTMAETVAPEMPSPAEIAACAWLPDNELRVYSDTFGRTGFQGGLNWYRCRFVETFIREQEIFAGRRIDVPVTFISGASDWGTYQAPGALEKMETQACSDYRGTHLVDGAGHWVQQEQPEAVNALLLDFIENAA